jgi:hypothetical protein
METETDKQATATYKSVQDYLNYLNTTYGAIIRKAMGMTLDTLTDDQKNLIQQFANAQDTKYNNDQPVVADPTTFSDDLFEILLGLTATNVDDNKEMWVRMHDAWALAYMYQVLNGNCPKQEGESEIMINESNFAQYCKTENKNYIKLSFNDVNGIVRVMVVQARRLTQFIYFSTLIDDEKQKDMTPVEVFRSLKDLLKSAFPSSQGGRRSRKSKSSSRKSTPKSSSKSSPKSAPKKAAAALVETIYRLSRDHLTS